MRMKTLIVALLFASSAHAAPFVNGGFESGNLSGWLGGGGYWYGGGAPVDPTTYNGGTPNNVVVGIGVDPITGAPMVYNGSYAARVNDSINNRSVSTLRQSVTGYTDPYIYFAWNAVLEDSHGLYDSDYFSLTLRDDTTGTDLVSRAYSSAGAIGAGAVGVTWTTHGNWYTSDWIVESIDLAALSVLGHDFTLTLLASDCPYSGHAGYVYLDGFGGKPPEQTTTPEPSTLLLFGVALLGATARLRRR